MAKTSQRKATKATPSKPRPSAKTTKTKNAKKTKTPMKNRNTEDDESSGGSFILTIHSDDSLEFDGSDSESDDSLAGGMTDALGNSNRYANNNNNNNNNNNDDDNNSNSNNANVNVNADAFGAAEPKQHPWSFRDSAEADLPGATGATTIDEKIHRRVMRNAAKGFKAPPPTDDDASDDDDSDDDDDDDDDAEMADDESDEGVVNGKRIEDIYEQRKNKNNNEKAKVAGKKDTKAKGGKEEDKNGKNKNAKTKKKDVSDEPPRAKLDESYFDQKPMKGAGKRRAFSSFRDLNLSRTLNRAVDALGYVVPTPIQAQAIPVALLGKDICGAAQTGSGKTAAFLLPTLERLQHRARGVSATRVLILLPTRELAVQCHSMCERLSQYTDIRSCCVVGGMSSAVQEAQLRGRPDIVVATPGRIIDHIMNSRSFGLEDVEILILDEADRLLEMGFSEEIAEIVRSCPRERQTMLFSATMTEEVSTLSKLSLKRPTMVRVDPNIGTVSTLAEEFVRIRKGGDHAKEAHLLALVTRSFRSKCLVFFATKMQAHRMKIIFGLSGLRAAELHGNLTQTMRLEALEAFRDGKVDYLLATDVAARGLDILGVHTVINFDMPRDSNAYIHRVGRTARAGRLGRSVTLTTDSERPRVKKVVAGRDKSAIKSRQVPAEAVDFWRTRIKEFEPSVREIFKEEKEEKVLRLAEMELNKARNMLDHHDEISNRPKKEWFQSVKEKKEIARRTRIIAEGGVIDIDDGEENDEDGDRAQQSKKRKRDDAGNNNSSNASEKKRKHKLTRKKRRTMMMDNAAERSGGKSFTQMQSIQSASVRAAKRNERLRNAGVHVPEDPSKKGKKKKNNNDKKDRGVVSGAAGKKVSGFDHEARSEVTKAKKKKRERTGSFKSKSRHKRR